MLECVFMRADEEFKVKGKVLRNMVDCSKDLKLSSGTYFLLIRQASFVSNMVRVQVTDLVHSAVSVFPAVVHATRPTQQFQLTLPGITQQTIAVRMQHIHIAIRLKDDRFLVNLPTSEL
jgi:hypothetical protein